MRGEKSKTKAVPFLASYIYVNVHVHAAKNKNSFTFAACKTFTTKKLVFKRNIGILEQVRKKNVFFLSFPNRELLEVYTAFEYRCTENKPVLKYICYTPISYLALRVVSCAGPSGQNGKNVVHISCI